MHTCLWKESPEVFERVVFVEFDRKYHIFLNIKTEEWGLNILLFNYWNDLALDSVETYVLEVGVYESLKEATTGVWEGCFCWLWPEISRFSKYKNRGGPKSFIAQLLKWSCLGSVKTFFLEVCAYVSLKRATAGILEGHFCWIWLEISHFFKYRKGGAVPKKFIV